jgi:uncharacterized membrane protein YebE (DUF533 family)
MKVDPEAVLGVFVRAALGHSGRKRARRAASFLSGNKGFLTASTLLAGAGLAWGIYDSVKGRGAFTPAPGSAGHGTAGAPGTVVVPPIPATQPPGTDTMPDDVLRIVRLAVSAARADGTLSPAERALILGHARDAGLESIVEIELAAPHPLSSIVAGVDDEARRHDLYVLAFTIVRADEGVSGAERIYLAQLAHQLGLDAATVARLEEDTAAKIDAS